MGELSMWVFTTFTKVTVTAMMINGMWKILTGKK